MSERITNLHNSPMLSSSNPYEEVRLKKITKKIRKRLLEHNAYHSTTITNNHSNLKLSIPEIKKETLPKINSSREHKRNSSENPSRNI